MTSPDFSGLTLEQRRLLDAGGWTADGTQASPSRPAAQRLVERGLLEAHVATYQDDFGSYELTEYFCPLKVRAGWMEYQRALPVSPGVAKEEP